MLDTELIMKRVKRKNIKELKHYCRDNKIKGFSNKKKDQLINF